MNDQQFISETSHGQIEAAMATNQPWAQENCYSTGEESTINDFTDGKGSFDCSTNATDDGSKPESEPRVQSCRRKLLRSNVAKRIASFVDPDFIDALESEKPPPRVWRTSLVRFGPLSGIAAMFIAIASVTASLGILAGSDGQPVPNWSATPSTYLAIFTAIANLSMRYAAIQGVVIAWWSRASNGSTLAKLHWDWRAGTTLRGALTAGRHMGLLGLACIFSTLVVVDDLQTKRYGSWSGNWPFNIDPMFNATIPTNHGRIPNDISTYSWPNNLRAEKSWYDDDDLVGVVEGCKSQCELKLRTLALFPTSCTTYTQPVDYKTTYDYNAVLNGEHAPPLDSLGIFISVALDVSGEREKINLITGYSTIRNVHDCHGILNYTICSLEAGIGDYHVQVENDRIKMNSLGTPELVSLLENPVNHTHDHYLEGHLSTLAPVVSIIDRWFSGFMTFYRYKGFVNSIWAGAQMTMNAYQDTKTAGSACPSYLDPREEVMKSMTKIMAFMAAYTNGLHAKGGLWQHLMDEDLAVKSKITAYRAGNQNVYNTEYKFFIVAAVIELVCIALVAPTYWGWWKLGRPVSFSPLETAKAFESPMFTAYNSNSSGRDLAKCTGNIRVQYGAKSTKASGEGEKLAFASPDIVNVPRDGSRFDP